jgi:CPA1 family monovalent cation:H+ antiporter
MLEIAIIVIAILGLSMILQERLKIALPVSLLLLAIGANVIGLIDVHIDSAMFSAILLSLLPLLIAGDAVGVKYHDFKKHWFRFLYLACVSVGLSVIAALSIHKLILPEYGLSYLALALLYIPATATDPVAVGSVMGGDKSIPRDLKICAESESLLNDLFALIFFSIAVALLEFDSAGDVSAQTYKLAFHTLLTFIIPLVIGASVGVLGILLLKMTHNPVAETIIIVLAAYMSFYGAEHYHASGILAIVVSVVMIVYVIELLLRKDQEYIDNEGDKAPFRLLSSAIVRRDNHVMVINYIKAFGLLAVAAVFVSMVAMIEWKDLITHWKAIVVIFLSTTLIRFVMMAKFVGMTNISKKLETIPYSWIPIMGFAGVRGGLSIVMLSLFLPDTFEHKALFETIIVGVILLSTLICPIALSFVLKALKDKL